MRRVLRKWLGEGGSADALSARAFDDLLLEIACNACEIDFIKRPKPGVLDLVQLHRILELLVLFLESLI